MFKPRPTNPELLSVEKYSINTKTDLLIKHFETIEDVFEKEWESLSKLEKIENDRTKDDEDDEKYNYDYSILLREIEFVSLRLHRYASILTAYSYLESSMSKICLQKKNELNIPISAEELKGNGIANYKKYLEKFCASDFAPINHLWSDLEILNKVRNCIIHCGGDAYQVNGSESFIKIVNATNELSFIEETLIMVTRTYVLESIRKVSKLLEYLVTT